MTTVDTTDRVQTGTTIETQQLDQVLAGLQDHRTRWARLPVRDKIHYLEEVRDAVLANAVRWVDAEVDAKQFAPDSALVGAESWIAGPYGVTAWLSASIETLGALDAGADPLEHVTTRTSIDGRAVARVLPINPYERLLFNGVTADVWMQDGVTPANLPDNMAGFYRQQDPDGAVSLVLGAGNVAAIVPLDILDRMINHGDVVVCKMNPVNDYLQPIFADVFAPLVRHGYLAFVSGGVDVGGYLTGHDDVDNIHITGAARTHDLIVYGPGEEGERRKAADERLVDKPIRSELGGVGGTIVVPGPWSDADFTYQAEHVATQKLHNAGHNCVASQVLVLPRSWDGSTRLLDEVTRQLDRAESRLAYYPGTDRRLAEVRAAAPDAIQLGDDGSRLLLPDVDPDSDHMAFTTEFFGPAMAATRLPGDDATGFLSNAVDFCNERLFGTLSVNLIVHPTTRRELGEDFDRAIAELRYGGIGINVWVGAAFMLSRAAWGAHPGHTLDDVQSGIGAVHNALMFDRPEKTVVEAPFRPFPRSVATGQLALFPKPPWFLTNATSPETGRRLTEFAADPGAGRLPGLFASALRG